MPAYQRYTGNNVKDMIRSDRSFAQGRGDELSQESQDRAGNESRVREGYRAYGDEVYDPLIGGRGGYNPDEAAGIMNTDDFGNFMTNQGGYAENYLSPEEQSAAMGRPWDRAAYFNPGAAEQKQNESAGYQRGAIGDMERGLNESINGEKLGMSGDYSRGVDNTLSGMSSGVRGAFNPNDMRADSSALDRIRMTPEEEQDIVTRAGITGGMKYRSAADELDRRSRAAGMDPVGAAAVRGRYMRQASADGADAMTSARVMASNSRSGREATAEHLRMGGEGAAADIGTRVEFGLGDRALDANTTREGIRMGAERDISGRMADRATTIGRTRVDTEQGINAADRQAGQYNTSMGTNIATGIEKDSADRAMQIANNRQTVSRGNQTQQFQQGVTRNDILSNRATQVANTRRDDAKEGRGYLREQNNMTNQNAQNEFGRQSQIYATQGQMAQGATQAQQQQNAQPKWWEKAIAGGIAAVGAATGTGGVVGALKK